MVKVLVVDDSRLSCKFLESSLTKWGFEVLMAFNADDALKSMTQHQFSVVITDWVMPNKDGLTLVKELREISADFYVYIIIISSTFHSDNLIRSLDAGADDFMLKPFNVTELKARLNAAKRVVELERALKQRNEDLELAIAEIKEGLAAAAKIQFSLLPTKVLRLDQVRVDWCFHPSQELGGDLLNYHYINDRALILYALDVSGHGVPAAMMTSSIHKLLSPHGTASLIYSSFADEGNSPFASPAEVAQGLNRTFQVDQVHTQYFTMIYGILDLETLKFTFCSAGHPEMALVPADGKRQLIEAHDVPVGFLENHQYENHELQLRPGDRLFLYSDGITEATSEKGEFFERERLLEHLAQSRDQKLEDSIHELLDAAFSWCKPALPSDDITIMGIEIPNGFGHRPDSEGLQYG